MSIRVSFIVVAVALAGCDTKPATNGPLPTQTSHTDTPVVYRCETGRTVEAAYRSDETVVVRYEGKMHRTQLAVSASGARYVGDGLEWWTKGTGSEGTLFHHQTDGTTGDVLAACVQTTSGS